MFGGNFDETTDNRFVCAAYSGNLDIVAHALANGINIDIEQSIFTRYSENLTALSALSAAILSKKYNVILFLLENGATISAHDYQPVDIACQYYDEPEMLKLLIQWQEIPNEILSRCLVYRLAHTLSGDINHETITIKFLLELGATIPAIIEIDDPLLCKIKLLLEYGQNIDDSIDNILDQVINLDDIETCEFLFEEYGLSISRIKHNLFKKAINNNSNQIIKYMLELGYSFDASSVCINSIGKKYHNDFAQTLIILIEHGVDILVFLKTNYP
jgi:hypothetical protein